MTGKQDKKRSQYSQQRQSVSNVTDRLKKRYVNGVTNTTSGRVYATTKTEEISPPAVKSIKSKSANPQQLSANNSSGYVADDQLHAKDDLDLLIDELKTQIDVALTLMTAKSWDKVIQLDHEIRSVDTNSETHRNKVKESRRQVALAKLYKRGKFAQSTEDWKEAENAYQQTVQLDRTYRDAAVRLTEVNDYLKCQKLRNRIEQDLIDQNWLGAKAKLEKIRFLVPDYQDAIELSWELEIWLEALRLAEQKEKLEAARKLSGLSHPFFIDRATEMANNLKQQANLDEQYKTGVLLYNSDSWRQSIWIFQKIAAVDPDYKDVSRLLRELKRRIILDKGVRWVAHYPWWTAVMATATAIFLLAITVQFYTLVFSTQTVAPLKNVEIWVDASKANGQKPLDIASKNIVEVEVKGFDTAGEPIKSDRLACQWTILPAGFDSQSKVDSDGCMLHYQAPLNTGLQEQAVLIDVVDKFSSNPGKVSTSVNFMLGSD